MMTYSDLKEIVKVEFCKWADERHGGVTKTTRTDPSAFACWFVVEHAEIARDGMFGGDHLRIYMLAESIRREALWGKVN